jgi:hypothetical protein
MANGALSSTASSRGLSEDWLAVWIGLLIFVLALAGLAGIDLLGWVVTTSVWTDATKALGTASKSYAGLGGLGALIATYVVLLVVLTTGAAALTGEFKRSRSPSRRFSGLPMSVGSPAIMQSSPP